ncbi:hypothetical protein HOY80DRAFT_1115614 [Tuber brumale]|nr:hypothetical protein HOY80DRAFT_1115614 [Tuber brumale]
MQFLRLMLLLTGDRIKASHILGRASWLVGRGNHRASLVEKQWLTSTFAPVKSGLNDSGDRRHLRLRLLGGSIDVSPIRVRASWLVCHEAPEFPPVDVADISSLVAQVGLDRSSHRCLGWRYIYSRLSLPPLMMDKPRSNSSVKQLPFLSMLHDGSAFYQVSAPAFSSLHPSTDPHSSSNSLVDPSSIASFLTASSHPPTTSTLSAHRTLLPHASSSPI